MSENKRGRTFRSRGYPNRRGHRFPRSHHGGFRHQYQNDCSSNEPGHVAASSQDPVQKHSHGCSVNISTHTGQAASSSQHEFQEERDSQGFIVPNVQNQLIDERLLSAIDSGTVENMFKVLRSKETCSQKGLDTAILTASRRGHKFMVQTLVQIGASLSSINEDGYTALMFATERGYVEIAKFLINKGADVNAQNSDGDSPLMLSILPSGSVEMIQFLVEHKANVNLQNKKGDSAIMKAIEIEDLDTIRVLIDADANLNLENGAGKTALQIAKEKQCSVYVTLFRDCKASKKNNIPLTKAVAHCNIDTVRMLLDCHISEVNTINGYGKTPLRTLIESMKSPKKWVDKMDILRLLLQNGADVNLRRSKQNPLLTRMTSEGSYSVVQLLCEHKAKPNILSSNGLSALMVAAKNGRKDLLLLLLNHGADVHMTGKDGENALFIALKHGSIDCVKILFDKSPKLPFSMREVVLELINCDQVTSMEFLFENLTVDVNLDLIHDAARKGNVDMVKLMIDKGADVNKPNVYKYTPLFYAANVEVAKLLVEHGADINTKHPDKGSLLIKAATQGKSELVRFFLNKGVFVDDVDTSQCTALILAIDTTFSWDCKSIVEMLLEMGADVNIKGKNGETALSVAVEHQMVDVISMLLDAGADMETKISCGETPFLTAARIGNLEILQVLKQRGANVTASDTDGCTALMKSVMHSKIDSSAERIKLLTDNNQAYLNRQNDKGFTSLMLTAQRGHIRNVLTLLELGADVNVMADGTTAMALLLGRHLPKNDLQCLCELVKHGALSSLPTRCSSVLHQMILLDRCNLLELLITNGMGPMVLDLKSVMVGRHISPNLQSLSARGRMSPLHVALSCGNIKVARYLVDIWFLTTCDIYQLPKDKILHDTLTIKGYTKCLDLLEELRAQPLSLLQLSFMSVSTCLGSNPGREERARNLPLPTLMQEKLLFHNQDKRIDMSGDGEEHEIQDHYFDLDDEYIVPTEHLNASFFSWGNSISDSSSSLEDNLFEDYLYDFVF